MPVELVSVECQIGLPNRIDTDNASMLQLKPLTDAHNERN